MGAVSTSIATSHSDRPKRPNSMSSTLRITFYQATLVLGLLLVWELLVRFGIAPVYLYGQPSGILAKGLVLIQEGDLYVHIGATAFEAITGFVIGTTLGSAAGLMLWLSDTVARVLRPIIVAINGVP